MASSLQHRMNNTQLEGLDYHMILDAAPDAMIITGTAGEIIEVNHQVLGLFGYSPEELIGKKIEILIPKRFQQQHINHRQAYGEDPKIRPMGIGMEFFGLKKDGSEFPVEVSLSPSSSSQGSVIIAAIRDISSRKEAEDHQTILLGELDHRVKNILAVISSIARQTIRHSDNLEQFEQSFNGRLSILANVHQLLAKQKWKGIRLRSILDHAISPFNVGKQISIQGSRICIPPNMVQSVCLAAHELITNAIKYGALSVPEGRISISWKVDNISENSIIDLTWQESGGPPPAYPVNSGYGMRLIERIVKSQLNGELDMTFHDEGLVVRCTIPLPTEKHISRSIAP